MADTFPASLESSTEILTIRDLKEKIIKQKKADLTPVYQRDVVWGDTKKSAFIDSLMRGFIPSNITMNINTDDNSWICIDGKQRISSIIEFIKNAVPWSRIEDDSEWLIFYNNVPDEKKGIKNCASMSKADQEKFLEKSLIIVSYKNLDYNTQCEIFNRIQNSMSATSGEHTLSLFKNKDVAAKFKQLCRNHDYMGKARFRNLEVLLNALYMKKIRDLKILSSKKEKQKFIQELDDMNIYDRLVKLTEKHFLVFFGDEFMGHKDVLSKKLTKNFIVVMFYMLMNEQTFPLDATDKKIIKVRRMIIKIWDKWNIIDGDINKERSGTSTKVLEKIKKLYEDNSAIMTKLDANKVDNSDDSDNDDDDNDDSDDNDNDDNENNDENINEDDNECKYNNKNNDCDDDLDEPYEPDKPDEPDEPDELEEPNIKNTKIAIKSKSNGAKTTKVQNTKGVLVIRRTK